MAGNSWWQWNVGCCALDNWHSHTNQSVPRPIQRMHTAGTLPHAAVRGCGRRYLRHMRHKALSSPSFHRFPSHILPYTMILDIFVALTLLCSVLAAPTAPAAPVKRATGVSIQYAGNQCLGVFPIGGGPVVDNSPVRTAPCPSGPLPPNYQWDISRGSGLVRLSNTNYCLDAGINPHNNVLAKVYTCSPYGAPVPQQQWYYTDDNRIAITGGNQCLDQGPSGAQTYQCTPGNTNQVWIANTGTPPTTGVRIHPNGDITKCLVLANPTPANDVRLNIASCEVSPALEYTQRWLINKGNGQVKLASANYCLDATLAPGPGVYGKIYQCFPDYSVQQWYYTDDNHIANTGGTQCLSFGGPQAVQQYCGGANQAWTTST